MALLVELFEIPERQRWVKTDHVHCKNAQKQHINVARMLESCIHGRQGAFHEFSQTRSVHFSSQCFEIPAMHKQAVTSGLPISFYMASESCLCASSIFEEEPMNLVCSDAIKKTPPMRNTLDVVLVITKLTKKSPRWDALLQKLKAGLSLKSPGICVLCPTHGIVIAESLDSILANYEALQSLWTETLEILKDVKTRGQILGVDTYIESFDFFFSAMVGKTLLWQSDNLSRALRGSHMSAAEGQSMASMPVKTLQKLQEDDQFTIFWIYEMKRAGDNAC